MKNRLGDALANAVVKPVEKAASSTLIGPDFIGVLEAVYRVPGISVNGVVSMAGCSWSRCKRLLDLAVEKDYLEKMDFGAVGFFPPGLRTETAAVLFVLSDKNVNRLMSTIMENPGMTKRELASSKGVGRHRLAIIEKTGLISLVADGRNKRFFPSGKMGELNKELEDSETKRARDMMKLLRSDGLEPRMEKTPGGKVFLRIDHIPGRRIPVSLHVPRASD
ncbi:MAG: hypothetical protein QCI38_07780 [Candidatus Thermoplasmatota archaeon]|nr:hypothetical protein [Candidatus Thermoplasmatota archaeon]